MEKDRKKILWKIEELWQKYYKPQSREGINIDQNYTYGVSKYYGRFHQVDRFNFTSSDLPVFKDDYGEYLGLLKYQVYEKDSKPIYLFDNHNEIIYPFVELSILKKEPLSIIHIDAHPDDAIFTQKKPVELGLKDVADFIQETRISDFFDALSDSNILNTLHPVTHSDSFEFFTSPEHDYALSLDIDIFGPEGDFCELEDKVRSIALAWSQAEAVCIATSPGFIDQNFAREIINIFTADMD